MAWQRKTPFGYMVRDGETVPFPEEAGVVQEIFTRYLAGATYNEIAERMSRGNIPYHQHTNQWNKHMIKRILENEKYLGTDIDSRIINDDEFLAVQLQKKDRTDFTPYPAGLKPIREKAVCAVCGGRIKRDTKSHGRSRWVCPDCGAIVRISDETVQRLVSQQLRQLADTPIC